MNVSLKSVVLSLACIAVSLSVGDLFAATHALIIGVGKYHPSSGADPLEGTAKDIERARAMSESMGAQESTIRVLADEEATKDRIMAEFERLTQSVRDGDKVFIYLSGHGVRYPSPKGSCIEGFISYTKGRYSRNDLLHQDDIQSRAIKLSRLADKVILMADTCHSGGIVARNEGTATRSLGGKPLTIRAKSVTFSGEACEVVTNEIRTRGLSSRISKLGAHQENFVQIAAAGPREKSWDTPDGGLSTKALAACLLGDAKDLDKTGAVTLEEIRACAQAKHNNEMAPHKAAGLLPSTIQIIGSRNIIVTAAPGLSARPNPSSSKPLQVASTKPEPLSVEAPKLEPPRQDPPRPEPPNPEPSKAEPPKLEPLRQNPPRAEPPNPNPLKAEIPKPAAPTPEPTRPPPPSKETLKEPTAQESSIALLGEIYDNRNPRLKLIAEVPRRVKIGKDNFNFTVRSPIDGYLYVVMLGSDGGSFYLLFPNQIDQNNYISRGADFRLPRKGWSLKSAGPEGLNRMLFFVSPTPRNTDIFTNTKGNGDLTYYVSDEANRRTIMEHFLGEGVGKGTRQYGAALSTIQEVK